jgi:hypothetical protein
MSHVMRVNFGAIILASLFAAMSIHAQEYLPVELSDLKASPQRYWAKGIVFRDVLKEKPGDRSTRINDRTIYRFQTEGIEEVFVFSESLDAIKKLKKGDEYLFSGTVAQRGRNYYVLVRDASAIDESAAEKIPDILTEINLENPTSQFNRVFVSLQQIMKDVQRQGKSSRQSHQQHPHPAAQGRGAIQNAGRSISG